MPKRSLAPWGGLAVLVASMLGAPALARADEAAAQALFVEARGLMSKGRWSEACPKLEESYRLEPGIGTRFNLGDCYEHVGRTASAWAAFRDVAAESKLAGQEARRKIAAERAQRLEGALCRLRIEAPPEPPAALAITRDGETVGPGALGVALPVDPGEHTIAASAPDHEPWSKAVRVASCPSEARVVVPALVAVVRPPVAPASASAAPSVAPPAPPPPAPPHEEPGGTRRALTLGAFGLGVVGIGVGAGFGLASISSKARSQDHCVNDKCDAQGLELRDDAIRYGTFATVAFAVGGVALAGGLVLWLTEPSSPRHDASASLRVVLGARSIELRGGF